MTVDGVVRHEGIRDSNIESTWEAVGTVEISHLKYGGGTREVVFAVEEAGRQ
jgi:hypothetical protein